MTVSGKETLFRQSPEFIWKGVAIIGAYCLIHLLMRLVLPPSLASDDAMEAFFSQQFQLVYSLRQPPLYSWLVYAAKNLLGDISLALVAVRYLLLFIMYTGLFLSASIMFTNRRVIVAVMVSYLLIRQYASLSHLNMTHTTLASAAIAVTFFSALVGSRQRAWWPYLLMGVAMGIGALAKYNFVTFPLSLLAAALLVKEYRMRLNPRILLSAMIGSIIFLTYYYAAQEIMDAEKIILEKNKIENGGVTDYLYSLLTFGSASLVFSSPLLIVVAIVFPGLLFSHHFILPVDAERRLLAAQILIAMLLLVVTGILLGIGSYKPRWMFPALILLPFYLFSVLETHPEYLKRAKKYIIGVAIFAVITLVSRFVNMYIDSYEGKKFHRILPVEGLHQPVTQMGFSDKTIVTDSSKLAGNLVMLFPKANICSLEQKGGRNCKTDTGKTLYISRKQPSKVFGEFKEHANLIMKKEITDASDSYREISVPLKYNSAVLVTFHLWQTGS